MTRSVQDTGVANGKSMGPSPSSFQQTSLENVLTMNHGEGEDSYSKNIVVQKSAIDSLLPELNTGLERMALPSEDGGRVVVVDLGCSSGPNSIHIVSQIVDNLRLRMTDDAEFQCYFNDLPSNDFNNLFRLLSLEDGGNRFFAAGLPGSFYGRLFPRRNVNVFYSSNSLHWLSKIPDAVLNKNSPAYNGGDIWYRHSRIAVAAAYKEQASTDLKNFLIARKAELVPGGLLFLNFFGTSSDDVGKISHSISVMNGLLADLISEGLVIEEHRDSFNIPVYLRSIEELDEAIQSCGSSFHVLTSKMHSWSGRSEDLWPGATYQEIGIKITQTCKSVFGGLLEASFPKHACSILWQRFQQVTERRLISTRDRNRLPPTVYTISLIRSNR